jgi:hypothetical protein
MFTCIEVPSATFNKRNFPPWAVVTYDTTAVCANAGGSVRATRETRDSKEYENHAANKNRPLTGKVRTRQHKKKKNKLRRRKSAIYHSSSVF